MSLQFQQKRRKGRSHNKFNDSGITAGFMSQQERIENLNDLFSLRRRQLFHMAEPPTWAVVFGPSVLLRLFKIPSSDPLIL